MISKKSWKEFRESGLLWFMNQTLHVFGWAIVLDIDENGDIVSASPARCKFRGFDEKSNDKGYSKVTKYLADNINELMEDIDEV